MSLFTVVQRLLDKAGTSFIEPRREDGHGSSALAPTFVDTGLTQPTTPADTQPVSGTVALDAPTLAALETVQVGNLPSEYPLPAAQVAALTPQTNALTNAELRAADVNTADSGEREYTHVVATVTAIGDTTIYTPAAGKRVRLRWIYLINDPTAATPTLIRVMLGAQEKYRVYALSKRQMVTGPVDGPLVINLSALGAVAVTAILEEV